MIINLPATRKIYPMINDKGRRLKLHFRRFEFKYLVSPQQHREIVSLLRPQLVPDPYGGGDGSYIVTSLYFDSPGLRYYRENEAGLEGRQKIRHRFYNDDPRELFWEIKKKRSDVVFKDRCLSSRPVAEFVRQLEYYRLWHRLAPMVWVRYLREAWQLPGGQLRITFDSGIQAVKARRKVELMPEWRKNLLSGWVVMELKYSGMLPKWIYRVISEYSLTRQPIGKYRLALEGLGMVLSV